MLFQDCTDWCKAHGKTIGQLEKAGWTIHIQRRVGVNLIFPEKTAKSRPGWGGSFCLPETKNRNHTALCTAFPA